MGHRQTRTARLPLATRGGALAVLSLCLACVPPPAAGDGVTDAYAEGADRAAVDQGATDALHDAGSRDRLQEEADSAPLDSAPGDAAVDPVDAAVEPVDAGGDDRSAPDSATLDVGSSDAADPDAGFRYICTPVGDTPTDGVFSLKSFGGHLYAGLFGYGQSAVSMIYRYPAWGRVTPGITGIGESICAMEVFDGNLYANTEDSGDIFRTSNGTSWERIYNGEPRSIGCGLEEFNGELYAINYMNGIEEHGRILRFNGSSFQEVYDSESEPLYLRELVAFDGTLYAFGINESQGVILSSTNGTSWSRQIVPNRFFRAYVWDGALWLGSSDSYLSGSEVAIWRYDGESFVRKHRPPGSHVTDLQNLGDLLFASTSNGFKEESGPSHLLLSRDRGESWETICSFSETAVWMLEVHDGELYAGSWEFGHGGSLYHVEQVALTGPDCSRISAANAAWEVCEWSADTCAGTFTDGAGCHAYCAAAGLVCLQRTEGDPGCVGYPGLPLGCDVVNDHQSDWCLCGATPSGVDAGAGDPDSGGNGDAGSASCSARAGALAAGATYTQGVDGHSGDEVTTQPKTDSNDGQNGDNLRFRRHNVARAHNDYWYTSNHQEAGEPDPNGEQWVDYAPDFGALGVGCYHIVARYRGTSNRALYAAQYRVQDARDGDVLIERVQERLEDDAYANEDLGNHFMCPESYVRIQDPGPNSISFNEVRFTFLGPECP